MSPLADWAGLSIKIRPTVHEMASVDSPLVFLHGHQETSLNAVHVQLCIMVSLCDMHAGGLYECTEYSRCYRWTPEILNEKEWVLDNGVF